MNFGIPRNNKYSRIEKLIYLITIIFLLILASEKFNRVSLTQQLALADNIEKFNQSFPEINSDKPGFSSGYFPGVAYFIQVLKFVIPDSMIYEVLFIFSVFFIFFFFYLNKKIINEIYPNNIDFSNYWLICIIFSFWLTRQWLWYALELKSDIFAFSLCFLALLISKPYKKNVKKNFFKFLISIILIAYAYTVKQQVLFFLFGMSLYSLYSLFNKNYFFIFFSLISFLAAILILYIFYQDQNLWWFTVTRHANNSYLTTYQWLRLHYNEIILIILFVIFILFSSFHNLCEINFRSKLDYLISNLKSNIWFYLIFTFSISGVMSSTTRGSNTGNTGLALILFFPFIYIFIYKFKKSVLIFVACAVLLFEVKNVIAGAKTYISAKQFQSYTKQLREEKNKIILTNRVTYFASRLMRKNNIIVSLSTKEALNRFSLERYNEKMIENELSSGDYGYIILNNLLEYGGVVSEDQISKKDYKKLFSNKLGFIYKKK